jgi:uncharacterized membrane protein
MPLYITIVLILGVIGLINTIYLSYHTFTKKPVACIFFPREWCEKVQYSTFSRTLGIPNSFAGFFIYASILVLTVLSMYNIVPFTPVIVIIVIGLLFSMYFLFIQAFVLRAFCTWCVLSAIEFILLTLTVAFLM